MVILIPVLRGGGAATIDRT